VKKVKTNDNIVENKKRIQSKVTVFMNKAQNNSKN
jgi:hypothetical protein